MTQNNLPDNMDIVVVIDKEKLPEDVRKMLEENLPKDIQDKVFDMLQKEKPGAILQLQKNKENKPDNKSDAKPDNNPDTKMYAIQTGTVVGNIYDKNFKLDDIDKK